tara:strand:- start:260 stop:808 length:549 start_codon:yes stop_codon:yes gene_type:complete
VKQYYIAFFLAGFFLSNMESFANEKYTSTDNNIEIIEVEGKKPLSLLRKEYKAASFALFETFNDLVEESDMHYICEKKRLPNSRISYKSCQNAFDIRIRDELFKREMNKHGDLISRLNKAQSSSDMGALEIDRLEEKKSKLIAKLAEENEIFKKALIELSKAKYNYEQEHISQYGSFSKFEE